ncbi:MAG: amidohydrolase [Thermoflexales bacterium]
MSALLLHNARIYTADPRQPHADALAIANGRILAIGSDDDILAIHLPGARRENLGGAFITPGLIDAHLHLQWTGLALQRVALHSATSVSEAVARVRERAERTPPGMWIEGWGWSQEAWGGHFPTAAQLDAATQAHPVALRAKSGHALWVNTLALQQAGIGTHTPDPPGGQIVRLPDGSPSGVLLEQATRLVSDIIPLPSGEQLMDATAAAMRAMNRVGLTAVHCMDGKGGIESFLTYQRLREQGRSTLRVIKQLPVEDLDAVIGCGLRSGFGDAWLRVGGIKVFADGALGSRTAWMLQPYEGDPHNCGIAIYDHQQLTAFALRAHAHGLSLTVHAIGDAANRAALDALAASYAQAGKDARLRDRIEHAQVLHPSDIPRFGQLGVIASVQPIHATQDMDAVDQHWGQRGRYAYAFRSLLDSGARLALGSDAPVESFHPLLGMHAALTRQRADGQPIGGWHPQQRLNLDEVLHGYTLGAAYAGYAERDIGSLEVGKCADLVVWSHDLSQLPADALLEAQPQRVMVDGAWLF